MYYIHLIVSIHGMLMHCNVIHVMRPTGTCWPIVSSRICKKPKTKSATAYSYLATYNEYIALFVV